MNVGFLGLGSMGSAMARNILKSGNVLRVWNRTPAKVESLVRDGAIAVETPSDLAQCNVVFAMLANDEATRASILDSGLLAALGKTTIFVNSATISISLATELATAFAQAGVPYVAAPVLGRPDAAAAGKLNVIVAGSDAAISRIAPLLSAIGQKTWRVGEYPPHANVAKIAANFLIASAIESMSEAFAISEGNGLDPHALHEIVANTIFAGAPVYKNYGTQIMDERFEAGFALRLGQKDVGLAIAAGTSAGNTLPIAESLAEVFAKAVAAGDGEKDWTAVSLQTKPKTPSFA